MRHLLVACAATVLLGSAMPVIAQDADDLRAELAALENEIAEAEAEASRYGDGLIQLLAQGRREALLLSKALLEARIQGEENGARLEVVVPVVQPDATRAAAILEEMEAAEARIEAARAEAARYSGGLLQAMALSRVQTEELTLAQLRMGYLQAEFGIAFPVEGRYAAGAPPAAAPPSAPLTEGAAPETEAAPLASTVGPDWADPEHPEIDYSGAAFAEAHAQGQRMVGWWGIQSERAMVDDSPLVIAVNYSAQDDVAWGMEPIFGARCIEGQSAVLIRTEDYMPSDYNSPMMEVTLRLDDQPARTTRWFSMNDNHGVGFVRAMRLERGRWLATLCGMTQRNPFRYFRTSPEIIRLAVMMYVRFPLSLRNVEDLLHERGIEVSHETVRFWWQRFGPMFAAEIRQKRVSSLRSVSRWRWHLDEVFVRVNGVQHYLWRAVDHEGEVLESYVTRTRDKAAALKFLKKLMRRHGRPEEVVTDGLRSYGAALRELGVEEPHVTGRWENNRVENSHQPFRRRERAMLRFRRMHNLQKLASVHGSVHNHFSADRSLTNRQSYKQARSVALAGWRGLCAK